MSASRTVAVYCASSNGIDARYIELAAEVGRGIAARGWTLVSGGGRRSMMGAVALAAREGGARTIGVIPRSMVEREWADTDSDELVVTEDMRERKAQMERRADAFLALPGGLGTCEELFEVWSAGALELHEKPVVLLDPDGHWRGPAGLGRRPGRPGVRPAVADGAHHGRRRRPSRARRLRPTRAGRPGMGRAVMGLVAWGPR